MKDIAQARNSPELYLRVYYALAKIGRHLKAEQLGLLNPDEWEKKAKRPLLTKAIKEFLLKEIK